MYQIKIVKIETYETTVREYQKVADTGNEVDGKSVYAHVPFPTTKERETEILKANVEQMDVEKVIRAIYNLEK